MDSTTTTTHEEQALIKNCSLLQCNRSAIDALDRGDFHQAYHMFKHSLSLFAMHLQANEPVSSSFLQEEGRQPYSWIAASTKSLATSPRLPLVFDLQSLLQAHPQATLEESLNLTGAILIYNLAMTMHLSGLMVDQEAKKIASLYERAADFLQHVLIMHTTTTTNVPPLLHLLRVAILCSAGSNPGRRRQQLVVSLCALQGEVLEHDEGVHAVVHHLFLSCMQDLMPGGLWMIAPCAGAA